MLFVKCATLLLTKCAWSKCEMFEKIAFLLWHEKLSLSVCMCVGVWACAYTWVSLFTIVHQSFIHALVSTFLLKDCSLVNSSECLWWLWVWQHRRDVNMYILYTVNECMTILYVYSKLVHNWTSAVCSKTVSVGEENMWHLGHFKELLPRIH